MEKKTKTDSPKKKIGFSVPNLLKSNRFIFIISLIAAIAIWISVAPNREMTIGMTVNIDTANSSVSSLGLEVVKGQGQHVDVTVSGKWYVISELTEKDIKLSYSLADVTKTGEYELTLSASKATNNSDYEITKINPEKITVSFDYIYTRSFKIEALAPNITAADGFILDTPVINSDSSIIDITGPKTVVEKISRVVAQVDDKATLKNSASYSVPLKLYDQNNNEIDSEQLTLPFNEVDVTVPINKSKTVSVKVDFANVPEYYKENPLSYTLSVAKLNVIGPAEVIDTLDSVSLGTIDFTDITAQKTKFEFAINLPSGVKTIDDITKITCTLDLSSISSKSLNVTSFRTINAPTTTKISFTTTTRKVTVVGPKSVIDKITAGDVYLECDMTNYSENTGEFVADAYLKSTKYKNVWGVGVYQVQLKVG